jgi:hypothetical protein
MSEKKKKEGVSLFGYLKEEIIRGDKIEGHEELYTEKQNRVLTFMRTPRELEKLMFYGVLIMFDSFLLIYSILPLRVLWAGLVFMYRLFTCQR